MLPVAPEPGVELPRENHGDGPDDDATRAHTAHSVTQYPYADEQVQTGPVTQQQYGEPDPTSQPAHYIPSWSRAALSLPKKQQQMLRAHGLSSPSAVARVSRSHMGSVASWSCTPLGPQELSAGLAEHADLSQARVGWDGHLLGTRLMARRGRSTRTVRMAERLTLCPSREYSIILGGGQKKGGSGGGQVTTRWRAGP